jgi:acetyltransferase-like isoleucine patch superfamily enzyme
MPTEGGIDRDRHSPKPLSVLVRREARKLLLDSGRSLLLRLSAASRVSYVHPRASLLKPANIRIGRHCQIYANATIRAASRTERGVTLGSYGIVRENAYIDSHGGWIYVAKGAFIGQNAVIYGQGGVEIGENTMLAPGVTIIAAGHSMSTEGVPMKFQPETYQGVRIGNDCWLGANVVVLDGVHIGDGVVVGAGAVVTHDLAPGVVATGVPARVSRDR